MCLVATVYCNGGTEQVGKYCQKYHNFQLVHYCLPCTLHVSPETPIRGELMAFTINNSLLGWLKVNATYPPPTNLGSEHLDNTPGSH